MFVCYSVEPARRHRHVYVSDPWSSIRHSSISISFAASRSQHGSRQLVERQLCYLRVRKGLWRFLIGDEVWTLTQSTAWHHSAKRG